MTSGRIHREKSTVNSMIRLYCRVHHHPSSGLCGACSRLIWYSNVRLDRCIFGGQKPVCSRCPVHCYKPDMREKIRDVMRYAGPRMLLYRPWLAIMHIADKYKKFAIPEFLEANNILSKEVKYNNDK